MDRTAVVLDARAKPSDFLPVVRLTDVEADPAAVDKALPEHRKHLLGLLEWMRTYLMKPNPDLGRKGPVCPYVSLALQHGTVFVTIHPGTTIAAAAIEEHILWLLERFSQLEPTDGSLAPLKTTLCMFPDLPIERMEDLIEAVQGKLLPSFVEQGLILGEFHPGPPDKPGVRNPDFRPLACPFPLLGIRNLVSTDYPFLQGSPFLFRHYLARFSGSLSPRLATEVAAIARELGLDVDGLS